MMNYELIDEIFKDKMNLIYRYLIKLGCSKENADDIVQDTFYKALRYIDGIQSDKLSAWLFKVAINKYYDLCRKNKRHIHVSIDKVIVNIFLTSSIFIICHGVIIVYLIFRFGVNNVPSNEINVVALKNIYEISKILYIVLLLVIIGISSSAFSIFVMGLATATNRKIVAYVFPPFYMITTGILFDIASINNFIDFNVIKLFNLIGFDKTTIFNVLLYDLILIILGLIIVYKFSYKKNLMILNKTS